MEDESTAKRLPPGDEESGAARLMSPQQLSYERSCSRQEGAILSPDEGPQSSPGGLSQLEV